MHSGTRTAQLEFPTRRAAPVGPLRRLDFRDVLLRLLGVRLLQDLLVRARQSIPQRRTRTTTATSRSVGMLVGGGASGRDAAQQISPFARATYISLKPDDAGPDLPSDVQRVPLVNAVPAAWSQLCPTYDALGPEDT